MHNVIRCFENASLSASSGGIFYQERCRALEPARSTVEHFLREKVDDKAIVFILDRDENYPILLITPSQESKLDQVRQDLAATNIVYSAYPGINVADVLSVIEKQGNRPYGVALNASKDIVNCLARSLARLMAGPDTAPSMRIF